MKWARKIHKWASLIVSLQFLIWLGTGLYFNLMDHHKAAGYTYKAEHSPAPAWHELSLLEPADVLAQHEASATLTLISLANKPYYLLNHQRGLYAHFANLYSLIDATNGQAITVDAEFARVLAQTSYSGPGAVASTTLMQPPIADFLKQQNPLWQVNFADEINTSVYIEAQSGRLVGHSDEHKRLADFFLKLHFMDYANTGSFNNVLMMFFAIAALGLCGSGLIWTIVLARRGFVRRSPG
ncbi:PepSY domain-containing protein [Rheinheimera maricola]|uniref:PepSY domain-containing protein n=1 Tax=Rheinheimera maricola TaxID=2793282 RepID=A0ABS7XC70_9GAMM|nr:PepSY domain-containing protein [Rheinheimera maricola]MBZ9613136.1 PepSY domain-containing protein [Rheinheimera maricola]